MSNTDPNRLNDPVRDAVVTTSGENDDPKPGRLGPAPAPSGGDVVKPASSGTAATTDGRRAAAESRADTAKR